ncbi:hypothetical protein CKK33_16545 [Mucilaginibacter sp. MD40]|uniref:hypothetical protein n=1 Tax=Mucilaginibacter sp. MD40 TaxID=2029590 RepID=UPI000BACA05A|nr:hypothetical protein [Mucilaginibacter sp. MD40]PAW95018.1 hypothetical protein CKK33_16545 [Mucilaginibacter sp. MD40]
MKTEFTTELVYTGVVGLLLALWFVATVICQFRESKASNFIRHHLDTFGMIPLWTFFAPSPGKRDYHLLFRDKYADQTVGEWQQMEITEERKLWSCIWNPQKRDKKVISDVVQNLVSTMPHYRSGEGDYRLLMFSMPYLIVLHAVSLCKRVPETESRQFMLAESCGYIKETDPTFILLSVFHQI